MASIFQLSGEIKEGERMLTFKRDRSLVILLAASLVLTPLNSFSEDVLSPIAFEPGSLVQATPSETSEMPITPMSPRGVQPLPTTELPPPVQDCRAPLFAASSDSFLGTLALNNAYAEDSVILNYRKRLDKINVLSVPILTGIAGVGLAQNIINLAVLKSTEPEYGARRAVGILGVAGTSVAIISFAGYVYLYSRYRKRIRNQQAGLKARIDAILARLQAQGDLNTARAELSPLVGEQAAAEFVYIWQRLYHHCEEAANRLPG